MSNLVKKQKVWRSGRSIERCLGELHKFCVEGKRQESQKSVETFKCVEMPGKGASSRDRNQVWETEKGVKEVGEKKEVWKKREKTKDRRRQLDVGLLHLYGQNKKAARRVGDKGRNNMEEGVYHKLEEDVGRKMTHILAHDRD